MGHGVDRKDKGVFMEAHDHILLCNKLCRASRKRMKRITSKTVRRDAQRRDQED